MTDNFETLKNELKQIIAKNSLLTSDEAGKPWKLASGRKSSFYFDMKLTLMAPRGLYCAGELILSYLKEHSINLVGGLAIGAIPLICSASLLSINHKYPIEAFFVRKNTKPHGHRTIIEGMLGVENLKGKEVLIIDDVTTTGSSSLIAVECARTAGARVEKILTVVNRNEGAEDFLGKHNLELISFFTAQEFLTIKSF